MSIKLENVKFKYNKNSPFVLNDINITIENGSINVLLGLNGCGKTTLIKALAGLFKTVTGNIYYDNQEIKTITIKDRSKLIAYVPQKIFGIDDVKVKDYLTYGMVNALKFYESPSEKDIIKINELSKLLKVDHLLNKNVGELSGGERQIICLCSALIQDTKIILLDEPTSALDLKNQNLVLTTLQDIVKKENKTIILSSHNPNHALFLNCNVALMNNGSIVKYDLASNIINIEQLKDIYGENICLSSDLPYNEISFKTY